MRNINAVNRSVHKDFAIVFAQGKATTTVDVTKTSVRRATRRVGHDGQRLSLAGQRNVALQQLRSPSASPAIKSTPRHHRRTTRRLSFTRGDAALSRRSPLRSSHSFRRLPVPPIGLSLPIAHAGLCALNGPSRKRGIRSDLRDFERPHRRFRALDGTPNQWRATSRAGSRTGTSNSTHVRDPGATCEVARSG